MLSDEQYAKLLVPDLLRLMEDPPWDAASYEVRRHAARIRLGLDSDEAVEEAKGEMAQKFAQEFINTLRKLLGNKELRKLKQEAKKNSSKENFSPLEAIIDKLPKNG